MPNTYSLSDIVRRYYYGNNSNMPVELTRITATNQVYSVIAQNRYNSSTVKTEIFYIVDRFDLNKPIRSMADSVNEGRFDEKGVKEFFHRLEVKEQFNQDLDKILEE